MRIRLLLLFVIGSLMNSIATAGVIFTTSYTAAEGFANAPLINNPNWVGGSNVAVRPGTTGFVRNGNVPSDDPTYHIRGALSNGSTSTFGLGDQIKIDVYIQFDLPGPGFAQEIARFGFSGSAGSNALEQGIGVVWDEGVDQPAGDSGSLRFFPDFNDYVFVDDSLEANEINSLTILGSAAGLDVNNTMGQGVDVRSNMFEVSYTAQSLGGDQWGVTDLSIVNLSRNTNNMFSYDLSVQPFQTFTFTGSDAFFGQRLVVRGQGSDAAIARSEYVTYSFNPASPVPEPSSLLIASMIALCGYFPRGCRKRN